MCKISVIMPAYKEKIEQFSKALDSILNQTARDLQIIIIFDDPDNDEIIQYTQKINDSRINIVINEKNIGLTKSLNKGISIANGEFIARMDSDDISENTRFQQQLEYLKRYDLDLCGAYVRWFNEKEITKEIKYPSKIENIKKQIFKRNCLAHPTFFAKASVFKNLNGYNDIPTAEDYDFLLRAINYGYKVGNVPEYLLNYRLNAEGISRSNPGKQVLISEYVRNFYKKNKKKILTSQMIDDYLNSKKYKRKISRYNSFYANKYLIYKFKRDNKFKSFLCSAKLVLYFDILLENIYNTLYSKLLIFKEERLVKNEIIKKNHS